MTKLTKECRMLALRCQMEGMIAENQFKVALGNGVSYCEDAFGILAEKIAELADEDETP
jgi:hypothetical protein